jgi:O-antigen ligase
MVSNSEILPIARDLTLLSCLITLVFTTSLPIDAFNPIKFATLIFGVLYIYVRYWSFIFWRLLSSKGLNIVFWGFFSHSLLILITNPYSISERLFGSEGRLFGFLTIWSLFLLGIANYLAVKSKLISLDLFFRYLFFIQKFEIGFTSFQNYYTVLPSTLGNPNFLAAFVAASFYSGIYILVSSRRRLSPNTFYATISITVSLYISAVSNSLQGPLGIAIGTAFLAFLFLALKKTRLAVYLGLTLSIISFPFVQGLFGKGIFGDRLEQGTLVVRSMYWRIAGRIGLDSPIFGHGFDTYLDNFRKFRSLDEVKMYGTGLFSDSPHNLFLDFFAAGGFPYLFWVIAGSIFVLFAAIKIFTHLKTRKEETVEFVFLLVVWMVLFLLSLINPFQLAVNVWNVVISFLIVGKYHQIQESNQKDNNRISLNGGKKLYLKLPLIASLIIFLNPALGILPFLTEIRFRSAIEKSDYQALRRVSTDWPFSDSRVVAISQGILDSSLKRTTTNELNLERQLQKMINSANTDALAATGINRNSFVLWRFIFYNHPDPTIKARARLNLVRLDPQDLGWQTTGP